MLILTGSLLGLLIGSVLGLTGAGGGIFAVPALVFGLGMSIRDAAPVALLAVGSAALLGALQGCARALSDIRPPRCWLLPVRSLRRWVLLWRTSLLPGA